MNIEITPSTQSVDKIKTGTDYEIVKLNTDKFWVNDLNSQRPLEKIYLSK